MRWKLNANDQFPKRRTIPTRILMQNAMIGVSPSWDGFVRDLQVLGQLLSVGPVCFDSQSICNGHSLVLNLLVSETQLAQQHRELDGASSPRSLLPGPARMP
ncbi:hypothetical protein DVH05_013353 [Phytophthora capsici]|nr:hypothetical protein DVH05_013353 [Phytophthora capsici]